VRGDAGARAAALAALRAEGGAAHLLATGPGAVLVEMPVFLPETDILDRAAARLARDGTESRGEAGKAAPPRYILLGTAPEPVRPADGLGGADRGRRASRAPLAVGTPV
jgi:hypothetical protein